MTSKDLVDLNTLFEDVSVMTKEQQEHLDLIELHVESTNAKVASGLQQLEEALVFEICADNV